MIHELRGSGTFSLHLWLEVNPGVVTEMLVCLFVRSFAVLQLSSCHVPSTVPGVGDALVSKAAVIPALIIPGKHDKGRVQEAMAFCNRGPAFGYGSGSASLMKEPKGR